MGAKEVMSLYLPCCTHLVKTIFILSATIYKSGMHYSNFHADYNHWG